MPKYLLLAIILLSFSACKTIRKITSRDNSNTIVKERTNRSVEFIDGIEVSPGNVVLTNHKANTTKTNSVSYEVPFNLLSNTKVEIEKVNNLQLKYAILLDTYIESISNIKLFMDIEEWWGTNYCMGGNSKECIDCSSFTGTIMRDVYKINLSRTASEQYKESMIISAELLKEGDLVFFNTGRRKYINHVGIFLANNKFVHASTSSGVTISDLNESYWKNKFEACGRVIN